jgi:hypothetical protein
MLTEGRHECRHRPLAVYPGQNLDDQPWTRKEGRCKCLVGRDSVQWLDDERLNLGLNRA